MSEITQNKLILPGSQVEYNNLSDVNDKYFIYCSTFSVFIFNKSDFKLISILGDNPDKYISSISLSQSKSEELLALYYTKEILIYNLYTNKYSYSIPFNGLKKMKFNQNSNLLILNNKGELYISKLDYNGNKYINKIRIDEGTCTCFKWYPFNTTEFAYSTDKNKIYYTSLNKNNSNIDNNSIIDSIKNKKKEKYIHIKDDENFSISNMEFYDLDENYKYLLVGTTNSKIYLLDLINYEITNKFNKYGKTPIQYIFWLNNQPGSFISINEKIGRYVKWNVSRFNYTLIGKISDLNLTSCVKFDNNSNFLVTNINGEVSIINILENNIMFQIKDNHNQCIYDLKINPNNDDLFITASFDGNIKLYSIKNNYNLIYNFNTNNNLNNLKTISSISEENNISSTRLGGYNNLNNNDKNHVFCVKWAPLHPNLFASGDSFLNLRIFDISLKKQIISYKCPLNNNVYNKTQNKKDIIIHGINWNKKDNILLGVNISIFLFSFTINNNNDKNEKYSLILINELQINNIVYTVIFGPNDESVIAPCEDGKIYFYNTTKDKTGKIIDINSSPSKEISGHTKSVYQVTFNNSKKIMASSSDDLRIGIYDYEGNLGNSKSKQTSTITKFLVGQENPIRQIVFLIDDTLISGSWNGIICIWNVVRCQLMYKIAENQSDVYGLTISKDHPFLFAATGRDGTIRFWNLNYKINLLNLLEIDNSNRKDIECFIKKFFYEEDFEKFFNLLNSPNKENELIDSIFKREESIKSEYSKYNLNNNDLGINNKIDFSLKQNDVDIIIENLIKESAVIGAWKLFCELNILKKRWEDAICFAPKVSLEYWQSLMNKYEEYINSEDYINNKNFKDSHNYSSDIDDIRLIGLLNGKNYKQIIENCIKQKDFQNALMIWLIQKSQNIDNDNNSKNNNDKNYINIELDSGVIANLSDNDKMNIGNNIKNSLNKDDNIKKLFEEATLVELKEGKRIKAIYNYLYIDDKFLLFKTLYKTYFIELGYLLCNFENSDIKNDLKDINDLYVLSLYEKYKNKIDDNIISQLINKLFDDNYKNILYKKISNKKDGVLNININNNKSEIFSIIENSDTAQLLKLINKYKQECFNKLVTIFLDKDNKKYIEESELNEISMKLSEYQKILILLKMKETEIPPEIKNDIIYSVMFLECLNYNYKSLICLIIEFFISRNILDVKKEANNGILFFIFNFVNYIQNNFKDKQIVKEYKLNYIHQQKYNLISSIYNKNLINIDKFNNIRKMLRFNEFYKCDINELKLFYLQNEIYPRKINKDDNLSTYSNMNINSSIVRLISGNYASQSEYLEMGKFLFLK